MDPACAGLHDGRDLEKGTPPTVGPVNLVEGGAHTCGTSTDWESRIASQFLPMSSIDARAAGPWTEGSTDPACGGLHGARNLENIFCPSGSTAIGCAPPKNPGGTIITDSKSFDKNTTCETEEACPPDVSGNPDSGCNGAVSILSHTGGQPVILNLKVILRSLSTDSVDLIL